MPKLVKDFLGFQKGDIITLSDLQTQQEYNELSVDFIIKEVRTYKEPAGFLTYTGYIAENKPKADKEAQMIMLLIRQISDNFDLRVFYLDQDGDAPNYGILFTEEQTDEEIAPDPDRESLPQLTEDLVDRFEVTLHFNDGDKVVTWDKQGKSVFGVQSHSTKTKSDTKTIAEYFTNDDTHGNPHCFIEWTGSSKEGWIEVWYGCEVTDNDVEIFHYKKI